MFTADKTYESWNKAAEKLLKGAPIKTFYESVEAYQKNEGLSSALVKEQIGSTTKHGFYIDAQKFKDSNSLNTYILELLNFGVELLYISNFEQHDAEIAFHQVERSFIEIIFEHQVSKVSSLKASYEDQLADLIEQMHQKLDPFKDDQHKLKEVLLNTPIFFHCSTEILKDVCALRALRVLIYALLKGYNIQTADFKVYAYSNQFKQERENRLIEQTLHCFSGFGGCADVFLNQNYLKNTSVIESEKSLQVFNTLNEEGYLSKQRDPFAESYLVEKTTKMMAQQAWNKFLSV